MSYDTAGAIKVLQDGLKPDRPQVFAQADGLVRMFPENIVRVDIDKRVKQLIFELAWTLLSQRRYEEAAEAFIKITEINSWYVLPLKYEQYLSVILILSFVA